MLTKNKIKFIKSLQNNKFRNESNCFVVEGEKLVGELIESNFNIKILIAEPQFLLKASEKQNVLNFNRIEDVIAATSDDLQRISSYISPPTAIAVAEIPEYQFDETYLDTNLAFLLDVVQNPGNLGGIMRVADWFGIQHIICSENSVDVFNPKVVQATMGAICRLKVHYVTLIDFLEQISKNKNIPVYGTFLEGQNIYQEPLTANGLIILGNEGRGISEELNPFITNKLYIPHFPADKRNSESLNVSTAAAVVCSEFRRRQLISNQPIMLI